MTRRKRVLLVAALVLLALLAAGALFLVFRGMAEARDRERFEARARADWKKISRSSEEVASALGSASSPEDLQEVSKAAAGMRGLLEEIRSSLGEGSGPSGYEDLARLQVDALKRLDAYLAGVVEFASADAAAVLEGRGLLEDKSRRAFSAVNEFLAEAPFDLERPVAQFYQAPQAIVELWTVPTDAQSADASAAYETVTGFLEADKNQDFQKIFSMISSRLKAALEYYKISPDDLARDWRRSWDNKKLVDYYISKRDVTLPQPDQALVRVVAYVDDGTPVVDTVRLVREQGAWKIDGYPFVGWE